MKASLVLTLTIATTVLSARTAFTSLSSSEQSNVKEMLAKWKTLYGPIAKENGFLPPSYESLDMNSHSQDELERFHNTMLDVEEVSKLNPLAQFSPFNEFALLTNEEFKKVVQQSYVVQNRNSTAVPLGLDELDLTASEADWTTSKCNPPVKNQGSCGSCWAFSTVGTVEAAHCIATGELLDLSEQQVVSCDKKSYGCDGGFPPSAIDWMQQGLCTEQSYPYKAQTGTCNTSCQKKQLSIGKTKTTSGDSSLVTVLNAQPATVVVEAGNAVWSNYKGGVITHCPGSQSDHAVIAVGYGTSTDSYFKIKNSWGPQWGDKGYIYLKRGVAGKGTCNVVEEISFPEVKGSPAPTSKPPSPSTSSPSPSPTKPRCTKKPKTRTPSPNPTSGSPNPTSASPTPSSISPPSGTGMKDQLMYQTNKVRAAHGIAPLTWDEGLAAKVQAYASSCPGFKHGGPPGSQNLATNDPCGPGTKYPNCMKITGGAWLWYYIEEKWWNYDTNRCNGDWLKCGHFATILNIDATAMGCGWSECGGNQNYVWCNYVNTGKNEKFPRRLNGMTLKELEASLTV